MKQRIELVSDEDALNAESQDPAVMLENYQAYMDGDLSFDEMVSGESL